VSYGSRLALARNQNENPSRAHAAQSEKTACNRIQAMEIKQQPAVEARLGNRRLK
jgi:hypothetical protein